MPHSILKFLANSSSHLKMTQSSVHALWTLAISRWV